MSSELQENKFLQILSKACNNTLAIGSILKDLEKESYHKFVLNEGSVCLVKCDNLGNILNNETTNTIVNVENDIIKGNTFSFIKSWINQFKLMSTTECLLEIKAATKDDANIKETNMEIENLYVITYRKQLIGFCNIQEIKNLDTIGFEENILEIAGVTNENSKSYLYFLETYNSRLDNEIIWKIYDIADTNVIITETYQMGLEEWSNRGAKIYRKATDNTLYCVILSKSDFILNLILKNKLKLKIRQYDISIIEKSIENDLKRILKLKKDYYLNKVVLNSDTMKRDWCFVIELKEKDMRINQEVIHYHTISFIKNYKYAPWCYLSGELLSLYGIMNADVIPKYFNTIFENGKYHIS